MKSQVLTAGSSPHSTGTISFSFLYFDCSLKNDNDSYFLHHPFPEESHLSIEELYKKYGVQTLPANAIRLDSHPLIDPPVADGGVKGLEGTEGDAAGLPTDHDDAFKNLEPLSKEKFD